MRLDFWLLHTALLTASAQAADEVQVELSNESSQQSSRVLGSFIHSEFLGKPYYAFRGVPYARPPVGELRFKDPQPLPDWPAIIDARYDGHDCPSIYATNASEDCLNLNVYSSQLSPSQLLPVLVFIHPGGLYIGSGLSSFLAPDYLLSKPLTVVTFNYRLGTLGFLSLGNADVPGNAGFKDQLLALRWVQAHIASFGGNSRDVTLIGYSAGALSVSLHLVSSFSSRQLLFHKAIVMSGSLPPQASASPRPHQRALAAKQAALLGCALPSNHSDEQLLECLNHHNGTHIAATLRRLFDFGKDNPMYLWLPVQERPSPSSFLSRELYAALQAGNFSRVPLLVGYNNGEFCSSAADILGNATLLRELNEHFDNWAPKLVMYERNDNKSHELRRQYLIHSEGDLQRGDSWQMARLCDLFSDGLIRFGAHRLARFTAAAQTPVFAYEFAQRQFGLRSHLAYEAHWGTARVEHLDDLMYLFRMGTASDAKEAADIVQLYVNFMYEFIRTGELRSADGVSQTYPRSYAQIANNRVDYVQGTPFAEADFWDKLFP